MNGEKSVFKTNFGCVEFLVFSGADDLASNILENMPGTGQHVS